jgi:probable phosphoglycerate mutase
VAAATRILVIRHGESTWNAQGRWQGQADPPLTATGEAQARQAAAALAPVDAIVASDLRRAARTAALIAEVLGHHPVHLEPRLRERHAGAWQGLTMHEVEAAFPGYLADAAARAPGGTVLAVSHGGILRAIRKVLGAGNDIGFANLSGQWFEFGEGGEVAAGDVRPGATVSLLDAPQRAHHAPL